jgi:hypothetical protein
MLKSEHIPVSSWFVSGHRGFNPLLFEKRLPYPSALHRSSLDRSTIIWRLKNVDLVAVWLGGTVSALAAALAVAIVVMRIRR